MLTKFDAHVEYRFTHGVLAGRTLAIGFYLKKNVSRFDKKVTFLPAIFVMNSDVPATYMSNLLSVFRNYQ